MDFKVHPNMSNYQEEPKVIEIIIEAIALKLITTHKNDKPKFLCKLCDD